MKDIIKKLVLTNPRCFHIGSNLTDCELHNSWLSPCQRYLITFTENEIFVGVAHKPHPNTYNPMKNAKTLQYSQFNDIQSVKQAIKIIVKEILDETNN